MFYQYKGVAILLAHSAEVCCTLQITCIFVNIVIHVCTRLQHENLAITGSFVTGLLPFSDTDHGKNCKCQTLVVIKSAKNRELTRNIFVYMYVFL